MHICTFLDLEKEREREVSVQSSVPVFLRNFRNSSCVVFSVCIEQLAT